MLDDDDDAYDQTAVGTCSRIERSIEKLRPPRQGALVAILNAIEYNVELGSAEPDVIAHLAEAFLALARADSIKEKNVAKLTRRLDDLRAHVEARAVARRVRR